MNKALHTIEEGLRTIGYPARLIHRDYRYATFDGNGGRTATAALAAFAQEPPSAVTACIGALTPEQMRSAFYLGAPVLIEIDGEETPIGDGSALPYLEMVKKAGIQPQEGKREIFQPRETIHVEVGEALAVVMPRPTVCAT